MEEIKIQHIKLNAPRDCKLTFQAFGYREEDNVKDSIPLRSRFCVTSKAVSVEDGYIIPSHLRFRLRTDIAWKYFRW